MEERAEFRFSAKQRFFFLSFAALLDLVERAKAKATLFLSEVRFAPWRVFDLQDPMRDLTF